MCNNPDIANAFFRAGMIESWGRGIEKIIHQCLLAGLPPPVFDTTFGGLQIEFYPVNKTVEESIGESVGKSSLNPLNGFKRFVGLCKGHLHPSTTLLYYFLHSAKANNKR